MEGAAGGRVVRAGAVLALLVTENGMCLEVSYFLSLRLLEGLGLQIAAFQEALSILVGKIPDEDPYGDGKKEK